jgi:ribosomal protein S18 acetylase RimI-like enzyme
MPLIDYIQSYLRYSAQQQYETVAVPPFTLFFHRSDPLRFFNYAIPDAPITDDVQAALLALRQRFIERNRQPRFEFLEEYAPTLAGALEAAGFVSEGRFPMMVCTPDTLTPAPSVAGLTLTLLVPGASVEDARGFLTAQRLGFDPTSTQPVTEQEIDEFLARLDKHGYVLAKVDGIAVSAGVFTAPYHGVTELAGIATLPAYRRRGIAAALTEYATRTAFAQGVEIACLSAGDEQASRVYHRIGFQPMATMLAYSLPELQ